MTSTFDKPFFDQSGCFCIQHNHDPFSNFGVVKQPVAKGVLTMEGEKKKQEIDALLSDAMSKLTFEEREKQQEALHGVDDSLLEEANFIDSSLVELDNTILHLKCGSVYETAEQMNPHYVRARSLRIMFLRGNRYNVKDAAEQMLKFFQVKQTLFGIDKLTEDITIEDLDEDDLACMRTGWHQFSGKDRPGREVVLMVLGLRSWKTLRNEMRMKFFMLMDLLKDETIQRRGVVCLTYAVDNLRDSQNGAGYMEQCVLSNAIPLHYNSVHYCCNELSEFLFLKIAISTMPQKIRSKFKVHIGSPLECQYRLSTYGISSENLPLVPGTNTIDLSRHIAWCRSHSVLSDSEDTNFFSIKEPTSKDVLYMRKGRSYNSGNRNLRNLVVQWAYAYDSGTNETKRNVVNAIINNVHRSGGRFLRQSKSENDSEWIEVPREEVRLKITQAFRNRRRKTNGRSS